VSEFESDDNAPMGKHEELKGAINGKHEPQVLSRPGVVRIIIINTLIA
jgi:hypothetical protein